MFSNVFLIFLLVVRAVENLVAKREFFLFELCRLLVLKMRFLFDITELVLGRSW